MDYTHFLDLLLADAASRRDLRATLPIFAVDECANHPAVRTSQSQALREGLIDRAVDLWHQLRRREDGSHVQVAGKLHRQALPPGYDIGAPVKGHAWPDEYVAQLLVAQLGASDRVVLVSENTRRNSGGIRSILARQVAPALAVSKYPALGILAFMKKGRTPWEAYAEALIGRLRGLGVEPGYHYVEV